MKTLTNDDDVSDAYCGGLYSRFRSQMKEKEKEHGEVKVSGSFNLDIMKQIEH